MAAPSKNFTVIADSAIDADSPITEDLMTDLRDNDIHLEEWLGLSYTAAQNHDHDGVNSALIQIPASAFYHFSAQTRIDGLATPWSYSTGALGFTPVHLEVTFVFRSPTPGTYIFEGNGFAWGVGPTGGNACGHQQNINIAGANGYFYSHTYLMGQTNVGSTWNAWTTYPSGGLPYGAVTAWASGGVTIAGSAQWATPTPAGITNNLQVRIWGV